MCRKGEITVFLAMILFSVCALLCVIVESARTAGARCYLRMAVNSSADSLMAQYHRELWNKYRILGLEYDKAETLEKEFREFMRPYMEAENWYPMKAEQIRITDMTDLTQGDGRYFEQEILDYMKYGLLDADWDELDEAGASELLEAWKEGNSVNRVSELYAAHSREAVKVEKALETINSTLLAQKERWEQGKDCLDQLDGGGFVSRANKMIRELERLPGQVRSYEKRADDLYEKLVDSREKFLEEASDLSGDVRAGLEEEISQYEAYAAQDGQRRREVEALTNLSRDRILWIRDVIDMAEAGMEYISSWEGTVVSGTALRLSGTPSVQRKTDGGGLKETDGDVDSGNNGFLTGVRTLLQRLLIGEYDIRFFNGFKKEMQKGEFYELEYIIHGKEKDRDNLSGVAARLVAFREGLNLVHILSDAGKRQEARNLALTIVGGTGILPLVSVVAFFIMAVWALGEALLDVRCLLEGKRVPVFKTGTDWKLDLAGLLEMGRSGSLTDGEGGNGSGTDYKGYLRILIFGGYDTDLVYRMMDVMQIVTAEKQPGFTLANCVCTVDAEALVSGKHVFFSNGLWKSRGREGGYAYDTRMAVAGSYLEDYKSP